MPRLYLNNDSYPELRDVQPAWMRTIIWWRAILTASRHVDFWLFVATQMATLATFLAADAVLISVLEPDPAQRRIIHLVAGAGAVIVAGYLQVSLGGDMMRRHLRAVSEVARYACPGCGHSLRGHLQGEDQTVRCPECAANVPREVLQPPHRLPRVFRAFRL